MNKNGYEGFLSGVVVELWRNAVPAERACQEANLPERSLMPGAGKKAGSTGSRE